MSFLYNHLLNGLIGFIKVTLSIGISDAIELYTEPRVHLHHNCPDIMRMKWEDYTPYHAFLSGIKVSWFLFLPTFLIIPFDSHVSSILSLFNIAVPILVMFIPYNRNYYLGHEILYLFNTFYIVISGAITIFSLYQSLMGRN